MRTSIPFRALHRAFGSKSRYLKLDVYDLDIRHFGPFDIVLFRGVLYHLKYPLLALERICAVTLDRCIVDSFVTDGEEWKEGRASPIPLIEFYGREELSGQLDNWWGPTVGAVLALARAGGFAIAEALRASRRNRAKSFLSVAKKYIELRCARNEAEPVPLLDLVFPEVDGFGLAPLLCAFSGQFHLISFGCPRALMLEFIL